MLRIVRKLRFPLCAGVLSLLLFLGILFPNLSSSVFPYRFYHVLTNSMEPTIKTNSLVLVKGYDDSVSLEKDDIIVFWATRFGERIVIMHRFSHTETNEEGQTIYRTHPEGSDALDVYETKAEDLLGVYLFHIPYIGKFALFVKSGFGLLWVFQIAAILLTRKLILARWEEKQKAAGPADPIRGVTKT